MSAKHDDDILHNNKDNYLLMMMMMMMIIIIIIIIIIQTFSNIFKSGPFNSERGKTPEMEENAIANPSQA
jgi:heme/copper-type cytochrome/quinol oxidase subunit 2